MVVETFEKLQCKDKLQKVKELQTKSKTGFGIGYLFSFPWCSYCM